MTAAEAKKKYDSACAAWRSDPEVIGKHADYNTAVTIAQLRNKPAVEAAYAAWQKAIKERKPKQRWPENTPPHILEFCKKYWSGTTELPVYRIHCWNAKAVVTGYPSGGYTDNGGWNPTPARFMVISLTEQSHHCPVILGKAEGRQSKQQLQALLESSTS